ncbi:Uncharacterized protein APZ42_029576 [Daphnia magna]|uniref:Uncharacterized protein n=1 Tax=Daphnia magna TaxID=35525 RepID=A0A164PQ97_9CRUS|nr:Uncharacterized protein APZ42_029576 [Daphnia magna]
MQVFIRYARHGTFACIIRAKKNKSGPEMCVRFRSMAKSIDAGTIMLCTFAMTTVYIFLFLFCLLLFYLVFENNHFIFH